MTCDVSVSRFVPVAFKIKLPKSSIQGIYLFLEYYYRKIQEKTI